VSEQKFFFAGMKKIGLLSDTHSYLDPLVFTYFANCDEIWHAGDIGSLDVTDRLREFKPLRAVWGNIDNQEARREFKETEDFVLEGVRVVMTHIGGKPYGYASNIRPYLAGNPPAVFICGHSHICRVEMDKKLNMLYMNPGAAGIHGFHHMKTMLRFDLEEGKIKNMEVIELGPRSAIAGAR
jgi:putative phosphoesterase